MNSALLNSYVATRVARCNVVGSVSFHTVTCFLRLLPKSGAIEKCSEPCQRGVKHLALRASRANWRVLLTWTQDCFPNRQYHPLSSNRNISTPQTILTHKRLRPSCGMSICVVWLTINCALGQSSHSRLASELSVIELSPFIWGLFPSASTVGVNIAGLLHPTHAFWVLAFSPWHPTPCSACRRNSAESFPPRTRQ